MPTGERSRSDKAEFRRRLEQQLEEARSQLGVEIAARRGGSAALARYTERIDSLLRQIFNQAASGLSQRVCILALGGYGRRQLCPYSDIDLLVLFEGRIARADELFLKAILHPLWDLRLDLGHQVREIDDFRHLEKDNPEFLLALLDARFVAGEHSLYQRFDELFHRTNPECYAQILELLLHLIEQRHARFNHTFYQLEPDVKEAPGALRDVTAGRWIRFLLYSMAPTVGTEALDSLQRVSSDVQSADHAEDFLLKIRAILHLESGRNQNTLSHPLQEKLADLLGYPGADAHQRVETFMSDYFRHARTASRFLETARRAAQPPAADSRRVKVAQNVERLGDEVRFIDAQEGISRPASWITVFRAAIDQQCRVSDDTLSAIRRDLGRYKAEDFFPGEEERDLLLDFLKPRQGLYGRLSEMHDCGLLGKMFPECEKIYCRVIRDFYHKYTVDEHTLLTIRNLERLLEPADVSRERFTSVLREIDAPELLVLSLLFHDVGKWKDEDHSNESVRMVQDVFRRIHLQPESARMVEFLISNHLQLSLVAFRRDTEDPEVVKKFAELVGTEENLKALCLLTLADIEAVSPETLTPWKEELLWQLFVDTYNHLTLGYGDEVIRRDPGVLADLLANRPKDFSESEIVDFLDGFPRRYLKLFPREAVYRHVRLSRDIHPDQVHISLDQDGEVWSLSVVTLDKPFLFSNICGVLSYFGMDILKGQAMTNPKGLVLDIFQFIDKEQFFRLNPDGAPQFRRLMEQVVGGGTDLPSLIRGKERSILYRKVQKHVGTAIVFDNHYSTRYTVMEIVAQNAVGLLYRISRVISRHSGDIHLVLISTEGNKAIDVFHLTGNNGKLSEQEQSELKAELEQALEAGYEIDQVHHSS
ncbi:MAG TPA: [protein-PII] uridylyltransferase [Acidobacteriota bacterium]|jgi:[protein-PII] uridylyltransferase